MTGRRERDERLENRKHQPSACCVTRRPCSTEQCLASVLLLARNARKNMLCLRICMFVRFCLCVFVFGCGGFVAFLALLI